MSVLDGLSWVVPGPGGGVPPGFLLTGTWWLGPPPGAYLDKYVNPWTDLTAPLLADPLVGVEPMFISWGRYTNSYALIYENGYLKSYDGANFTDLQGVVGFIAAGKSIYSCSQGPTFWLVAGGDPFIPWHPKIVKLDNALGVAVDVTAGSGFAFTVFATKYCPELGYFAAIDWTGAFSTYDGVGWTARPAFGGLWCYKPSLDWNGHILLAGGTGGTIKSWDGLAWTDLTVAAGFADDIHAVKWNGTYWLVGSGTWGVPSGTLKSFDGVNWVPLKVYAHPINAITWDGKRWWIVGGDWTAVQPDLFIETYDGAVFTDMTAGSGEIYSVRDAEWCANV